ncbi:hypothetical protein GOODEAATRI_009344, partial [Goodea atripinnis]
PSKSNAENRDKAAENTIEQSGLRSTFRRMKTRVLHGYILAHIVSHTRDKRYY